MEIELLNSTYLNAYALRFSGNLGFQWNGLSISLAILATFTLLKWMVSRQRFELPSKMVFDFLFYCVWGVLIGARLGYCIFIDSELFFQFKQSFPFWGVLAINEGGFSSYGAILGGAAACGIFTAKTGISRLYLLDLAALSAPLCLFLTRSANFLSGELYGRPIEGNFPLSIKTPSEIYYWPLQQKSQLLELAPLAEKMGLSKASWEQMVAGYSNSGESQSVLNLQIQKILDYLSTNIADYATYLEPLLVRRYPVQLMGAFLEGLLLYLVLIIVWYRPRRPGVVTALFLILFSAFQFYLEPLREANPLDSTIFLGLSEQLILAGIGLLVGLVGLIIWNRSEILRAPGWGRGQNVKLHRR